MFFLCVPIRPRAHGRGVCVLLRRTACQQQAAPAADSSREDFGVLWLDTALPLPGPDAAWWETDAPARVRTRSGESSLAVKKRRSSLRSPSRFGGIGQAAALQKSQSVTSAVADCA